MLRTNVADPACDRSATRWKPVSLPTVAAETDQRSIVRNTATVSIGLPFFNAQLTLIDAVRSVMAQTYDDWELLLIDDGSSDGSLEVAQRIRHPRVHLSSDGTNRGLPIRLNEIAARARGKYLARMDADDLMHPQRLERQVQFLDENPAVDVVDTAIYTIDENNNPLGIRGDSPINSDPRAVLRHGLLIHPTVTGRARWFRDHPYDPVFVRAEDQELWSRVCASSVFGRLQEPLLFYRERLTGSLKDYLRTARTIRLILRVYGPSVVGCRGTIVLIAQSYAKCLTYWTCTKLGCQHRLIRYRSRRLRSGEAEMASLTLRQILRTPVPGI
jgi:glycosyltransferase involved in cell wall biosynthesis